MAAHGKGYQTERITINVTPEQAAAVKAALKVARDHAARRLDKRPSENNMLVWVLEDFCRGNDIDWPEHGRDEADGETR